VHVPCIDLMWDKVKDMWETVFLSSKLLIMMVMQHPCLC